MSDRAVLVVGPTITQPSRPLALTTMPAGARRTAGASVLAHLVARLGRLLGLRRTGGLTAEDRRVLIILGVALVVALGGQQDLATSPPADDPPAAAVQAAAPAGAAQVLDVARAGLGTLEAANGGTAFHSAYGIADKEPWCAVFLWDVFQDAGAAELIHPKTAYTPTLAGWFQERGQWSSTPTVGALVFYNWPGDSKDRIQHVGIVESFDAATITTIEGNTSAGPGGSQDDGDGVWRRVRPRNDAIVGYGYPNYGIAL